ncbi:4Fe-4S dicluster domain-containing protein [Methanobrevibacter sp. DSM 116169]|uniref:4Fe-4S dicluster domain-containing protein n=1 Tax=Methanobrevibacter sp. DSM 116169 TaxID=3242727 RepID=UPI0038FCCB16
MSGISVNPNKCIDCSICERSCPSNSIKVKDGVPLFCMNCEPDKANCLKICPTGAIESLGGAIILNKEKCNGCGACQDVCPIGAIDIGKNSANKCNFCVGKDTKECVESCPTNALTDDENTISETSS